MLTLSSKSSPAPARDGFLLVTNCEFRRPPVYAKLSPHGQVKFAGVEGIKNRRLSTPNKRICEPIEESFEEEEIDEADVTLVAPTGDDISR